jgi:hypothetical protein
MARVDRAARVPKGQEGRQSMSLRERVSFFSRPPPASFVATISKVPLKPAAALLRREKSTRQTAQKFGLQKCPPVCSPQLHTKSTQARMSHRSGVVGVKLPSWCSRQTPNGPWRKRRLCLGGTGIIGTVRDFNLLGNGPTQLTTERGHK